MNDLRECSDRSSDGSDTEGSLYSFIVSDDVVVYEEIGTKFAFDSKECDAVSTNNQPRRSKRKRVAVQRYQDDEYIQLMLTKGGVVPINELLCLMAADDTTKKTDEDEDSSYEASDTNSESDDEDTSEK